jgi:hypothetical protein
MFMYRNYRPERWYWEVVSTVQMALLVAISVFSFTLGAFFTTLLLQVSVVVLWAMQLMFRPFASRELHVFNMLSLACLFATTSIGLTLFDGFGGISAPEAYKQVAGVAGLLINVLFVLWSCYRIAMQSTGLVAQCVQNVHAALGVRKSQSEVQQPKDGADTDAWATGAQVELCLESVLSHRNERGL